jgi:riboflavin kinase/FMN adenylyltransferase
MRLFRHYTEVPVEARGAALAIGNFDGVHRGHQAVIAVAAERAAALGASLGVLTFEPHPREYFQPGRPSFRLTPLRIKVRQLEASGVDYLFVLHFDAELAGKSAEAFVIEVLCQGLEAAHLVIGYDFVFGRGRRGNAALLADLGRLHGFAVTEVPPAGEDGEVFSSTRIRECLAAGRPLEAARLLGRPWEIAGRVVAGDRLGRTLDYPTANIEIDDYLQPCFGVYAVKAGIDEGRDTRWHDGAAYVGRRPAVGGRDVRLEAHLFDFDADLYGRQIRVALIDHVRADATFENLSALKAQIAADAAEARRRLAAYKGPPPGTAPQLRVGPRYRQDPPARRTVYDSALRPRQNA